MPHWDTREYLNQNTMDKLRCGQEEMSSNWLQRIVHHLFQQGAIMTTKLPQMSAGVRSKIEQ